LTRELAIVFAGTPEFAVPALASLLGGPHRVVAVYTQPDRPAGRGRPLTESPIKRVARDAGVVVEQPATLKDSGTQTTLASYCPDVVVVVAYGLLLPRPVLSIPGLGCVNIHASLLPRWRGAAPIQRAIQAGDASSGVSIMLMDQGLDTGPLLRVVATPIGPRETAGLLHDRLAQLGAAALAAELDALANGRSRPQPQPDDGATYAHKIRKEEALLDFGRPAVELDRQIRAFNPWPVAETRLRGKQLRILEAEPIEHDSGEPPGTVLAADSAGLIVATGGGVLVVKRLQLASRKPVLAGDFANAVEAVGVVLGQ